MAEKMALKKTAQFERKYGKKNSRHLIQLIPLDYAILEQLPPEGSVLGFHVLGAQVKGILVKLREVDSTVTSNQVSGRMSSMHTLGLVTDVTVLPVDRGRGWQITPEGQKVLDAWNSGK